MKMILAFIFLFAVAHSTVLTAEQVTALETAGYYRLPDQTYTQLGDVRTDCQAKGQGWDVCSPDQVLQVVTKGLNTAVGQVAFTDLCYPGFVDVNVANGDQTLGLKAGFESAWNTFQSLQQDCDGNPLCAGNQLSEQDFWSDQGYLTSLKEFVGWFQGELEDDNDCIGIPGWNDWTSQASPAQTQFAGAGGHCCISANVANEKGESCNTFSGAQKCHDGDTSGLTGADYPTPPDGKQWMWRAYSTFDDLDNSNKYCIPENGACAASECCAASAEYPVYKLVSGFYSSDQAKGACDHLDDGSFSLCTLDQMLGVIEHYGSENGPKLLGTNGFLCTAGWAINEFNGNLASSNPVSGFIKQQHLGACFNIPTDNLEYPGWASYIAGSFAAAHCCRRSMQPTKVVSTHSLGQGHFSDAANTCANQVHHTEVCNLNQHKLAAMNENWDVCQAQILHDPDTSQDAYKHIFWQHNQGEVGQGQVGCQNVGWQEEAVGVEYYAGCCQPGLREYVEEATAFGFFPSTPSSSSHTDGDSANDDCVQRGFDGLCTQQELAWVGTNDVTDLCISGWVKYDNTDAYAKGFYQTTNTNPLCGAQGRWEDSEPSNGNPVAFCCRRDSEPSVGKVSVETHYFNAGFGVFTYTSCSEANIECGTQSYTTESGTFNYQLCTKDQLKTLAYFGVERLDNSDELQFEANVCTDGWYFKTDAMDTNNCGVGFARGQDSPNCGDAGWHEAANQGSNGASYHCCTDFEPRKSAAPSKMPTLSAPLAFKLAGPLGWQGQKWTTAVDAEAACKKIHSEYQLCTDAEVVQVAKFGIFEHNLPTNADEYTSVFPQQNLCTTSWIDQHYTCDDGDLADFPYYGYYKVVGAGTCANHGWYTGPVEDDKTIYANAFCCAPGIQLTDQEQGFLPELGCPNTDCVPEWTECNTQCKQTYSIAVPKSQNGADCPGQPGDLFDCIGGQCTSTVCEYSESTCNIDCEKTWTVTVPAVGPEAFCAHEDGTVLGCDPGDGACPPANQDCTWSFGACFDNANGECVKAVTLDQVAGENGDCIYNNGQEVACPVGEDAPNCSRGVPTNCVYQLGDCDLTKCEQEILAITTPASNGGNCFLGVGDVRPCDFECNRNCEGSWDCSKFCVGTFIVTVEATGTGTCDAEHNETKRCEPGEGLCPNDQDCVGEWQACTAECTRSWKVLTESSGAGQGCPEDGYTEVCTQNSGLCENAPTDLIQVDETLANQLGIADYENIYYKENGDEWYFEYGASYIPTCVAYGLSAEAACPDNKVCDGKVRTTVGTLSQQGLLLEQAITTATKTHPDCQWLKQCSPANPGYSPLVDEVSYEICNDGCYYANNIYTCVCSDLGDQVPTELELAFQNFQMQSSTCATPVSQTFDQLLEKQVQITTWMVEDLKESIATLPDATKTLENAEEALQGIWQQWHTSIIWTLQEARKNPANSDETNAHLDDLIQRLSVADGN